MLSFTHDIIKHIEKSKRIYKLLELISELNKGAGDKRTYNY